MAASAFAAADIGDPLRTLRGGHPRLILLDNQLDRLRLAIREGAPIRKIYLGLQKEAERMLLAPPIEYKLASGQLILQSRRALDRIYTLALLYRLDRKQAYLDRALKELRAAAAFRDWNPAHFPDVAEMAHAFAIGYDWLYPALSDTDREWIRAAIMQKAVLPGLQLYVAQSGWVISRFSINAVCNGGLTLGALSIADEEPEKAGSVIRYAVDSISRAFSNYGSDGSWPEGPAYWDAATRYCVYFLAGLQTGLGLDFGISNQQGFSRAGRFRIYLSGPTNKTFNFGDSTDELTLEPAMFWLARRYAQPQYAWQEQKLAERISDAEPLDLVWYEREARSPQGPMWPLDSIFSGSQCAFFRSAWDDPNAVFLAAKGGDNKTPRAHLDLGSFVLDAGGVRWALDLGIDDSGPVSSTRLRTAVYRARTESHNTLLIDGENQDSRAEAKIIRHDFGPDLSWIQIDLSKAYTPHVKQCQRRIGLAQRQAVLIQDIVQTDQPADVQWGMVTEANIVLEGQTAELTIGDWALSAEIHTPRHAVFDVVPTQGPAGQAPNTGTRKLVVRIGEKVTDLDLNISLTPHRVGVAKPKIALRFPAL